MPDHTAISTAGAPQNDNPYSQGVLADDLPFVSGFGPVDPGTGAEVEAVRLPEDVRVEIDAVAKVE